VTKEQTIEAATAEVKAALGQVQTLSQVEPSLRQEYRDRLRRLVGSEILAQIDSIKLQEEQDVLDAKRGLEKVRKEARRWAMVLAKMNGPTTVRDGDWMTVYRRGQLSIPHDAIEALVAENPNLEKVVVRSDPSIAIRPVKGKGD
jgi:hypothetical protein